MIDLGKETSEIKEEVNSRLFAKRLYSHIQGAIFMTYTMDDEHYLKQAMVEMNSIIKNEIEK